MTPFHVGMRVVCVDDDWDFNPLYWIKKGEVLEIAFVDKDHEMDSGVGLWFKYLPFSAMYCSSCFRPAHENRMDELRALLAPVPSKAKTLSPVTS